MSETPTPLWTEILRAGEAQKSDEHLAWLNWRLDFLYSRPVCKWVRLLRERNERDLAQQDNPDFPYYYDHAAADHAVEFFDKLKHSKGEWGRAGGQQFVLEPWQEYDIHRQAYGWMKKETRTRRFKIVWVEVAKKSGKSTYGSGNGLYLLAGDNEPGAEIYSAATKRDQARLIHGEAIRMVRKSQDLSTHLVTLKNSISMPLMYSKYEPVGSDSGNLDGINPHGVLADEIHRWKQRDLWDVLEQSMAARSEPMLWAFTTAGTGRNSFCYLQRDTYLKILQRMYDGEEVREFADSVYPYIATLDGFDEMDPDARDDPYDPAVWVKANPNLGVSIKEPELKQQAQKAKTSSAQENSYLRYRMNIWTEQSVRWLPMAKWDQCFGDWKTVEYIDAATGEVRTELVLDDMIGQPCYAGLDMAATFDIAALVLVFPRPKNRIRVLPFFFLDRETLEERWMRDKVPYPQWEKDGLIEVTEGDAIDYEYIEDRALELASVYDIKEFRFDPANAVGSAQKLEKRGMKMIQTRQGFTTMSPFAKAFEIMVRRRDLEHGGNKVLRWMASNAAVRHDNNLNIMPDKDKSADKIDGIVAAVMGAGACSLHTLHRSIYEQRGLIHVQQ